MIELSAAQVASATGGRPVAAVDATVTGPVVVDSRLVEEGSLFVALPGEHADGADFAAGAVTDGAALILANRELAGSDGQPLPVVVVDDVQAALGDLARYVMARARELNPALQVVAITGSVGKTTTKDLIGQLLTEGRDGFGGETIVPVGSFNNEIGLPLSVLKVTATTQYADLEMGADRPGDIGHLARIAPPNIGIVLAVGTAHMEGFGSREAIADAKAEMLAELLPGGVAVLNADDHRVAAMTSRIADGRRVVTFGRAETADICAENVSLDPLGRASFSLCVHGGVIPDVTEPQRHAVHLQIVGEHHVSNALAAASAAILAGIPIDVVAARLSAARIVSAHRMAVTERLDGITVIDDAYNANPESMRAALQAVATVAARDRRSVAVLGEMLELGDNALAAHDEIGRLAVRLNIGLLLVVGPGARHIFEGAQQEGSWGDEAVYVDDVDAARIQLAARLRPGDVVLVKASNGTRLWQLGDDLADGMLSPAASSTVSSTAETHTIEGEEVNAA
ncbi:MAG: UDP-N-acetylmuramoyl-tripeptide--D-alanyl-D-alanine ligase [Cellulomonadaceae bacterium]|jgi:UDP-N-acetylmuramoyl-tripeptide--D-alanyl-D-alanine ligase|nr:UDP-N-acetylmuramoyl-tripeptide--D-alanyl-D-alanine ligase [Cellulomonadaceae bacterium]